MGLMDDKQLDHLSKERLVALSQRLLNKCKRYEFSMLTKKEVAVRVGMTVSWLDNSRSELAKSIRASGVRYGKSRTAPVRYPLKELTQIMNEAKSNQ